jgi:hypothetical protein
MERNVQLRRELLAEVEAVAPTLAEHAADSEGLARLNAPSIRALRKTRLLRFICPKERGGDEADPVTHLEIIEALARIDGSAAWTVGILAGTSMIVAAFLPAASGKKIFAGGVPPWPACWHHGAARSPSTAATVSAAVGLSAAASIMRIGSLPPLLCQGSLSPRRFASLSCLEIRL